MRYDFKRISRLRILVWLVVLIAVGIAAAGVRLGATNQSVLRSGDQPARSSSSNGQYNSRQPNLNSNSSPPSATSLNVPIARPTSTRETQQRLTPLELPPQPNNGYRNYEAEALRTEIEEAEQSLDRLKSEIDALAEEMAPYKAQIDKYATVMKRIERDHDLGLSVDQDEYDRALRYHNYNVDLYNSKLAERRGKVSEYNELLTQNKIKINRYNGMIKTGR